MLGQTDEEFGHLALIDSSITVCVYAVEDLGDIGFGERLRLCLAEGLLDEIVRFF